MTITILCPRTSMPYEYNESDITFERQRDGKFLIEIKCRCSKETISFVARPKGKVIQMKK